MKSLLILYFFLTITVGCGQGCYFNSECNEPGLGFCYYGKCIACTRNAQCGLHVCSAGSCHACTSDLQCDQSRTCTNGFCIITRTTATSYKPMETTSYKPMETTSYKPMETTSYKPMETTSYKPMVTTPLTTLTPPTECRCGVSKTVRIVGGVETSKNEYPWQVALLVSGRFTCGGSIISDKTILTAAHCTFNKAPSNLEIVVGDHDLLRPDGEQRVSVCGKIEHPSYIGRKYDFSLLQLCSKLEFNTTVKPVCLPPTAGQGFEYENRVATVSGWGTLSSGGSLSYILQKVQVNTMSNTACCLPNASYRCSQISTDMICAARRGKDSCQGDSGGPLIVAEDAGYNTLIGVVSWGRGCAEDGYPGVYSRVTNQLTWIQDNMVGSTCPTP